MATKREVFYDDDSCFTRAADDEPIFVLRANDPIAAETVRFWAQKYGESHRIHGTLTEQRRKKQRDAYDVADEMIAWRKKNVIFSEGEEKTASSAAAGAGLRSTGFNVEDTLVDILRRLEEMDERVSLLEEKFETIRGLRPSLQDRKDIDELADRIKLIEAMARKDDLESRGEELQRDIERDKMERGGSEVSGGEASRQEARPEEQIRNFKKILCVDFDGVLHSYTSGWQGADVVSDPPVPGAIQWLRSLIQDVRFKVVIYSARSSQSGGVFAMKSWLIKHGLYWREIDAIDFPVQKPPAFLTIDDRAWRFDGEFPSADALDNFRTWQQNVRGYSNG